MKLDYTAMKYWTDIAILVVVALNMVYTWWCSREKVTNRRFSDLESLVKDMVSKPELSKVKEARDAELLAVKKIVDNIPKGCCEHGDMKLRMDGHNDRLGQHKELIVKIEAEFKSLPKKHDLEEVYKRVNQVGNQVTDLSTKVGRIDGILPGLTHITEMMNEFLLRQGSK